MNVDEVKCACEYVREMHEKTKRGRDIMKKFLSLLLAAVMMCSVLAACGSTTTTGSQTSGEESTGTGSGVELKFSTGGEQGTYYGFGNVLAQAITSAGTGTKVTAVTSNGSQDNIEQMEMNTRQLGFASPTL